MYKLHYIPGSPTFPGNPEYPSKPGSPIKGRYYLIKKY